MKERKARTNPIMYWNWRFCYELMVSTMYIWCICIYIYFLPLELVPPTPTYSNEQRHPDLSFSVSFSTHREMATSRT